MHAMGILNTAAVVQIAMVEALLVNMASSMAPESRKQTPHIIKLVVGSTLQHSGKANNTSCVPWHQWW